MNFKGHVMFIVLLSLFIVVVRTNEMEGVCRRIRKRYHKRIVTEPCIEKYKQLCGWFSLSYCTFYRKDQCTRTFNSSDVSYYQALECCDGYIMAPNGTCLDLSTINKDLVVQIQNETAHIQTKDELVNPEDIPKEGYKEVEEDDKPTANSRQQIRSQPSPTKKINLSHGAYAGIGCAIAMVLIVLVFIIVAVRKKKIRQSRKRNQLDTEVPIQRVIYQSSPKVKTRMSSDAQETVQIDRQVIVQSDSLSPTEPDSELANDPKEKLLSNPPKSTAEMTDKKIDKENCEKLTRNEHPKSEDDDVTNDVSAKLLEGSTSEHDSRYDTHNSTDDTLALEDDFQERFENSTETNI